MEWDEKKNGMMIMFLHFGTILNMEEVELNIKIYKRITTIILYVCHLLASSHIQFAIF